jgi:hypothetical protein
MSTKPHGLIVQFANGSQRHFAGKSALVDAIDYADRFETKVCVISTPQSVLDDLRGVTRRVSPERTQLWLVDRLDLLA